MRRFKGIEWNLQKINYHGLSAEEVEAAFDRVFSLQERKDSSFQMFAATPSGRRIWVIWRYDREDDEIPDVFGELGEASIFVITATSALLKIVGYFSGLSSPSVTDSSTSRRPSPRS